jgi:hypothetical protein
VRLLKNFVHERIVEGEPVQAGEVMITPVSRAWIIQLPGWMGGLIWNRPAGVRVRAPGQFEKYLPVRDLTRYVIWTIIGAGLTSTLVMLLRRRWRR